MNFDEKYEPKAMAELIFADTHAQATCTRYATGTAYKPLMLWGPPGTAKTTTARMIVRERHKTAGYDGEIQEFNGTDLTPGDFEGLISIASMLSLNTVKPTILINEFDELDRDEQAKFRSWMDAYKWINLIVTTNEQPGVQGVRQKLMPALQSRFERVELAAPCLEDCLPRAQAILQQEGFAVSYADLRILLGTFAGDLRDMLPLIEEGAEQLHQAQLAQTAKPASVMVSSDAGE